MHRLLVIVVLVLAASLSARADVIYQRSGASELPIKDVKITGISDGNLTFTSRGSPASRALDVIIRIEIDGEPALNQAEQAYVAKKLDAAVDGYEKALRATNREWLRSWIGPRLVDAAAQTGRFDAAVTGYIALLLHDPAAAARYKPPLPDAKSSYIDTAIKEVNAALAQRLGNEQRLSLLNFLLELQRAKGDNKGVEQTLEQLVALTGDGAQTDVAQQALAQTRLSSAKVALDAGDFHKTISEIESSRSAFTEPQQQAEALYLIARAQLALAQQSKDPAQAKDAGLAFMRVVAHFSQVPRQPRVADALLGAARVHELLEEKPTAISLYEQVTTTFRDTPQAQEAQQRIAQLKAQ